MIYYLSSTHLPSKKANAIQKVKMCHAFAATGEDVCFLSPENGSAATSWKYISDYYGLSSKFNLEPVPTRNYSFPNYPVPDLDTQLVGLWILYKYFSGKINGGDVLFSRYMEVTDLLLKIRKRFDTLDDVQIWFEQHQVERDVTSEFYDQLDGVVCISKLQKERMLETTSVDERQLLVAHDGVDLEAYSEISTAAARNRLGFDPDEQIVMYTGHLYRSKGVETLVRAAADFDAQCYIVGGYDEDVSRITSQTSIPENVTFTGFVPPAEIPYYQTAADILVATVADDTGTHEFFSPLKIFEYMAAGKPIVASQKPGYDEILTHDRNGLFVAPESVDDLAVTVERLLTDPESRTEFGRQARIDVQPYGWTNRARRILDEVEAKS